MSNKIFIFLVWALFIFFFVTSANAGPRSYLLNETVLRDNPTDIDEYIIVLKSYQGETLMPEQIAEAFGTLNCYSGAVQAHPQKLKSDGKTDHQVIYMIDSLRMDIDTITNNQLRLYITDLHDAGWEYGRTHALASSNAFYVCENYGISKANELIPTSYFNPKRFSE
jgi:hypothetical protein